MKRSKFYLPILAFFMICFAVGSVSASAASVNISEMFLKQNNVREVRAGEELPAYAGTGRGVRVVPSGNNATVQYKTAIKLSELSPTDVLTEVTVLSDPNGKNGNSLDVILTDRFDSNNYIMLRYWQSPFSPLHSYIRAGANGKLAGRSNESGKVGDVSSVYGTVGWFQNFNGAATGNSKPYVLYYDSQQKQFLIDTQFEKNFVVLDLDEPEQVGEAGVWRGFSSDEVFLSVRMTTSYSENPGFIVSKLAGMDFSGRKIYDTEPPEITVKTDENYLTEMPNALVGKKYPIPAADVYDRFSGEIKPQIFVAEEGRSDGAISVTYASDSVGWFVPKKSGEYIVCYYAADEYGNSLTKKLTVQAVNSLPEIKAKFSQTPAMPTVFDYYRAPDIALCGGSGKLEAVKDYRLNNREILPDDNGFVYIDEPGTLEIGLKITDYIGTEARQTLSIAIDTPAPIFQYGGFPNGVKIGETFSLPECRVIDFEGGIWETTVKIDGKLVAGSEYTVPATAGSAIEVIYESNKQGVTQRKIFTVPVIGGSSIADPFLADDKTKKEVTETGLTLDLKDGASVSYAYPLSANMLVIRFSGSGGAVGASFEIILRDFEDGNNAVSLSIGYRDEKTSYLKLNNTGEQYVVQGSLNNPDRTFYLIYDNFRGTVNDKDNKVICTVRQNLSGRNFGNFDSGAVAVQFSYSGRPIQIEVYQLSNQIYNSYAFLTGDRIPAALSFQSPLKKFVSYGETIEFPIAKAIDALSAKSTVTLSVFSPSGKKLLDGVSCSAINSTLAQEYGNYQIIYHTADGSVNKNEQAYTYTVNVSDDQAPELFVDLSMDKVLKKGSKIKPPAAVVKDNFDKDCAAVIMLYSLSYGKYTAVLQPDQEFELKNTGRFELVYYVHDSAFNIKEIRYAFEVTEG